MATEPVLRADVIAAPFDDPPRQAYADHLDAAPGGPSARAEFIRIQLRLAREAFAEPTPATAGNPTAELARRMEHLRLQQRERELLEHHAAAWAADILRVAARVEYRRGFVASVVLDADAFVQHGAWLLQRAPVVHMELTRVLPVLDRLIACPALAAVGALSLSNQQLDDAALRRFLSSPYIGQLWWLDLSGNAIDMPGVEQLAAAKAKLPRLRFVGLGRNPVDDPHETAGVWGFDIQDVSLPPQGRALEVKYGSLPWLHFPTNSMLDFPPDPCGPPLP